MVSFGSTTYSKRLLHLISWSHWFTFFNIIAAIGLSSFYIFNEAKPETFLGQIYLITTWLSHMGFLTFVSFVLVIFPLTLIYPKTKFIRATASIVFTLGLMLLLLDAFIYSQLGYHLNASSSDQIIALIQSQIDNNSRIFWFFSIILTITILAFQFVVSNYAWKHLRDLQKTVFAKYVVMTLVASFFFSHITHIWADAHLEYDVLRQDTVLPMSYPSTAKTLLTKYGLFDKSDYMARKTSPLSFNDLQVSYPKMPALCKSLDDTKQSAFIIVTDNLITTAQIKQFTQRSVKNSVTLTRHIDNALPDSSWFNMLYSLPTIYKEELLNKNISPLLFEVLEENNLNKTITTISDKKNNSESALWLNKLFDETQNLTDISQLVFAQKLNSYPPGLHVFHFKSESSYQFELFIDALLLAQKFKGENNQQQDILWISSIGNQSVDTRLTIKPALLILPQDHKMGVSVEISNITSHMDIQPTLMTNWLACNSPIENYSSGKNLLALTESRIIANTMDNGIVVFNKDKSVFIDQNGNFQSYSRQLESPITISSDFPLMIDGVNFIKQFALKNSTDQ